MVMNDQKHHDELDNSSFYLILPAYNEERNIRSVLSTFCQAFQNPNLRFHVVVNNSKDRTYENALAAAAIDDRIIVSNIPERIGKGGAILYGFKQAKGCPYIGFIDADGSIIPEAVERLIGAFQSHPSLDMAISSRWMRGAAMSRKQPLLRQLSSRSFNLFSRLLFGFTYHDTQCGAKMMRAEAWEKIADNVLEVSFAFDIDLLWQAKKKGLSVAEIPIPWHDTPGSSVNIMQSAWPIVVALFGIRFRKN
jgi:glycosyltransferase involved in cell wall biosynthesis